MSGEYAETLKRRAEAFLRHASASDEPDLKSFFAEQAAQLYLKAVYYEIAGETIRGHGIREILGLLIQQLKRAGYPYKGLEEFVGERREALLALEDAYSESRYGEAGYSEELATDLVNVAKELLELLKGVERSVLG